MAHAASAQHQLQPPLVGHDARRSPSLVVRGHALRRIVHHRQRCRRRHDGRADPRGHGTLRGGATRGNVAGASVGQRFRGKAARSDRPAPVHSRAPRRRLQALPATSRPWQPPGLSPSRKQVPPAAKTLGCCAAQPRSLCQRRALLRIKRRSRAAAGAASVQGTPNGLNGAAARALRLLVRGALSSFKC